MHWDVGNAIEWAFVASAAALGLAAFFFRANSKGLGRAVGLSLMLVTFGLMMASLCLNIAKGTSATPIYIGIAFWWLAVTLWQIPTSARWQLTLNAGVTAQFAVIAIARFLPTEIAVWVEAIAIGGLIAAGLTALYQYRSTRAV